MSTPHPTPPEALAGEALRECLTRMGEAFRAAAREAAKFLHTLNDPLSPLSRRVAYLQRSRRKSGPRRYRRL